MIARVERAPGFLETAQLSAGWVREVGKQALILELRHATRIEGTLLRLILAERLWKAKAPPEVNPYNKRELHGGFAGRLHEIFKVWAGLEYSIRGPANSQKYLMNEFRASFSIPLAPRNIVYQR